MCRIHRCSSINNSCRGGGEESFTKDSEIALNIDGRETVKLKGRGNVCIQVFTCAVGFQTSAEGRRRE